MFDWDRDFEAVVQRQLDGVTPTAAPTRQRPLIRRGVAALGVAVIGIAMLTASLPIAPGRAATMAMAIVWPGFTAADPMPDDLLAYERAQFDSFRRGIARFSDADLIGFAEVTQRSFGDATDPMTAYSVDAVSLALHEIERRGLSRPAGNAAFEALRSAIRARRAASSV